MKNGYFNFLKIKNETIKKQPKQNLYGIASSLLQNKCYNEQHNGKRTIISMNKQ